MQTPIDVRYHQVPASQSLSALIAEKAAKLERHYEHITGCTVTVEAPNLNHHRKGKRFRIRIALTVPGETIVVTHDPKDNEPRESVYAAVNDAFRAARRQLGDVVARRRAS